RHLKQGDQKSDEFYDVPHHTETTNPSRACVKRMRLRCVCTSSPRTYTALLKDELSASYLRATQSGSSGFELAAERIRLIHIAPPPDSAIDRNLGTLPPPSPPLPRLHNAPL